MQEIRLLLVEDDLILREGILEILKHQKDIKVIAASGNEENTVLKIHTLKPNIVLLDLGLRSKSSIAVVKMVKKEFPAAKIIIMDLAPVPADVKQFVEAGATGFILRDITVDEFLGAIRAVAEGKKILPPLLPDSLFAQIVEYALKSGKRKLVKTKMPTVKKSTVKKPAVKG